jgi:hypothetical protein
LFCDYLFYLNVIGPYCVIGHKTNILLMKAVIQCNTNSTLACSSPHASCTPARMCCAHPLVCAPTCVRTRLCAYLPVCVLSSFSCSFSPGCCRCRCRHSCCSCCRRRSCCCCRRSCCRRSCCRRRRRAVADHIWHTKRRIW